MSFCEQVFNLILDNKDIERDIGLGEGDPGVLAYLAVYNECFSSKLAKEAYSQISLRYYANVDESLANAELIDTSYFGGASGGLHILSKLTSDPRTTIRINRFDDLLSTVDFQTIGKLDWIGGAVGLGNLAVNGTKPNHRLFDKVVSLFDDGLCHRDPAFTDDLGIAHGVVGLGIILADYISKGFGTLRHRHILSEIVDHIRDQRQASLGSRFPYFAYQPAESRVAWCYGDLIIALLFAKAGSALEDSSLVAFSLELSQSVIERSLSSTQIKDSTFCHGDVGVAHIFNRLFQLTGHSSLQMAAAFWMNSFVKSGLPAIQSRVNGAGLLEGICGPALVCLSALAEFDFGWDVVLLGSFVDQT